jgi:hypothetical protein
VRHKDGPDVALDDPRAVGHLLTCLRKVRKVAAEQQITVLAERAAAHVARERPYAVGRL